MCERSRNRLCEVYTKPAKLTRNAKATAGGLFLKRLGRVYSFRGGTNAQIHSVASAGLARVAAAFENVIALAVSGDYAKRYAHIA
jgi:hypothetical protein